MNDNSQLLAVIKQDQQQLVTQYWTLDRRRFKHWPHGQPVKIDSMLCVIPQWVRGYDIMLLELQLPDNRLCYIFRTRDQVSVTSVVPKWLVLAQLSATLVNATKDYTEYSVPEMINEYQ